MKKTNHSKIIEAVTAVAALTLSASLLAGCGATADGSTSTKSTSASGSTQPVSEASASSTSGDGANNPDAKKIVCGVVSGVDGWGNVDAKGKFDGYEPAVLREVDRRLPQYSFELQPSDFNNILLSLDSDKIDLGTHMFEYTPERAEKYLYGKEGYFDFTTVLEVPADSKLTTLDDFAGKTVVTPSKGDASTTIIENYNKKNPDKAIKIDPQGGVARDVEIQSLVDGRWDAISTPRYMVSDDNKKYGKGKDIVKEGPVLNRSNSFYLYPKDGKHDQLQKDVDGALKAMKEDGTLAKISIKYIGQDVTPKGDSNNARAGEQ